MHSCIECCWFWLFWLGCKLNFLLWNKYFMVISCKRNAFLSNQLYVKETRTIVNKKSFTGFCYKWLNCNVTARKGDKLVENEEQKENWGPVRSWHWKFKTRGFCVGNRHWNQLNMKESISIQCQISYRDIYMNQCSIIVVKAGNSRDRYQSNFIPIVRFSIPLAMATSVHLNHWYHCDTCLQYCHVNSAIE